MIKFIVVNYMIYFAILNHYWYKPYLVMRSLYKYILKVPFPPCTLYIPSDTAIRLYQLWD